MSLIVKKFGGTSVANTERIFKIVDIIKESYEQGNEIIVVVSAMGSTTDELINAAHKIDNKVSSREMDVLLSVGEQISMSLLVMALNKKGLPAVSLTGWQAGFKTCKYHGNAKIEDIFPGRIDKELKKNNIVVVAGFQGINEFGDITTMGRGGSDTSAVALAAAMNADECRIYTDVKGVYKADPNIVKHAEKFKKISYKDMITFASLGTKVLNKRSVETAKKYGVIINVLSSFEKIGNTLVCETNNENHGYIKGISSCKNLLFVNIFELLNEHIDEIFNIFAINNISIINMSQNISKSQENIFNISFIIDKNISINIFEVLNSLTKKYKFSIFLESDVSRISIVTSGKELFMETLSKIIICLKNIKLISVFFDNNIISLIVPNKNTDEVVKLLYEKFLNKNKIILN